MRRGIAESASHQEIDKYTRRSHRNDLWWACADSSIRDPRCRPESNNDIRASRHDGATNVGNRSRIDQRTNMQIADSRRWLLVLTVVI